MLFFGTTINYTDRQVLGLLAPMLQIKIGWSEQEYAYIGTSFLIAYALGLLVMGGLIDRIGTRRGYAVCITIWSLAAVAHALVRTLPVVVQLREGGVVGVPRRPRPGQRKQQQRSGERGEEAHNKGE